MIYLIINATVPPPAASRFCDILPFRRSAILPGGLFYFIGDFIEISYEIKKWAATMQPTIMKRED